MVAKFLENVDKKNWGGGGGAASESGLKARSIVDVLIFIN